MLRIENCSCLVVGGGAVGFRKTEALLQAGAKVTVVSIDASPELLALESAGKIRLQRERYCSNMLAGMTLVFAATNNNEVNTQITQEAQAAGLIVNSADAPDSGSFIVPATVRRGDLCISISTGSASPKLAARIRQELEARFPENYALYLEVLAETRNAIKKMTESTAQRGQALEALLDHEADIRTEIAVEGVETAMELARNIAVRAMEQ
jgi:precorrin-2 dehydrogenase/sirohydrochlorin ferrochelatase